MTPTPVSIPELSEQEYRTLLHLWDGLQTKGIAVAMNLSDKTVKNYLHNLYEKLEVHTGIQAIRKAIDLGIIIPQHWHIPEKEDWP